MKNVNQLALLLLLNACSVAAQDVTVSGPDQRLQVAFDCQTDGGLAYSVVYDGKQCWRILLWDLKPTWEVL